MADVAKRSRNNRKALQEKNVEVTESPAVAAISKQSDLVTESPAVAAISKQSDLLTVESVVSPAKKGKATKKATKPATDFEKALEEMQAKLKELTIAKEKTEEMLREKDEILKEREEEIENRGREQEKIQVELKKLQKLKEFKPTLTFPVSQSLKEKEQDKKEKKKKGCLEKKKPSPPYILWCKDQWNEVKKENPEAEFKDISNILGTKWKSVTAEEKKPYEEKYLSDKESYLQVVAKEKRETEAMKLFDDEHKQKTAMELLDQYLRFKEEAESEELTKKKKKLKKEKDPLKPKQPISAFFLYTNERRPVLVADGKSFLEVAKITGEEWKKMTEKQKAPYEQISKKNKEKYSQEMEIYNQRKEEESASLKKEADELMKLHKQEAMQMLKKKEKTDNIIKKTKEENRQKKKKIVDPNKPKKPAGSYILFCKEARKAILETVAAGTKNDTISAMISLRWKELSEEERKVWNEEAAEAMEAYKKELEEYNKTVVAAADSEE